MLCVVILFKNSEIYSLKWTFVKLSMEILFYSQIFSLKDFTLEIFIVLFKMFKLQGPTNTFLFGKCFKKKQLNIFSNFFFYLKVQSFLLIMENNFIQKAASAGHAVAYTIGPIFKHTIDCVFHEWLHGYYPLKRQLFLACRRNTYL